MQNPTNQEELVKSAICIRMKEGSLMCKRMGMLQRKGQYTWFDKI